LPLLWDRALRNQNIKYREISVLERVNRNKNGLELWWKHGERPVANDSTKYEKGEFGVHPEQSGCTPNSIFQRNSFKKELVDYLLIAIGREPVLEFLSENVKTHLDDLEKGGLLYLIGDVKNSLFRQASIAAGDGVKAAMKANLRLNELKYI